MKRTEHKPLLRAELPGLCFKAHRICATDGWPTFWAIHACPYTMDPGKTIGNVILCICVTKSFFFQPYLASTELDHLAARRWRSKRLNAKTVCLRLLHTPFDRSCESHHNHNALICFHKHTFWYDATNFDEAFQLAWFRIQLCAQKQVEKKFAS